MQGKRFLVISLAPLCAAMQHHGHTWTVGSLLNSASRDLSILESLSSSLRYQNVCIADSGQLMRVSTCAHTTAVRACHRESPLYEMFCCWLRHRPDSCPTTDTWQLSGLEQPRAQDARQGERRCRAGAPAAAGSSPHPPSAVAGRTGAAAAPPSPAALGPPWRQTPVSKRCQGTAGRDCRQEP